MNLISLGTTTPLHVIDTTGLVADSNIATFTRNLILLEKPILNANETEPIYFKKDEKGVYKLWQGNTNH